MNVPTLQISNPNLFREFAYTVNSTNPSLQRFLGPRSALLRVAVATAASPQILELPSPATNVSYQQVFNAPLVRCQDANATVMSQIDAVAISEKEALDPSIREISNDYFAFVPAVNTKNSTSTAFLTADLSNPIGVKPSLNQIWFRFSRSNDSTSSIDLFQQSNMHYMVCELQNASYTVNFTWVNGKQSITNTQLNTINPVPYPTNLTYSAVEEERSAYSAFMWALSTQLIGHLSFYQDISMANDSTADVNANGTYSEIATNLDSTGILGSSDLNLFFQKNHALGAQLHPTERFSRQRIEDQQLARNRTLDVLIEELSFNITISLLGNAHFAYVTRTHP